MAKIEVDVHVILVHHKHGTNCYMGLTYEEVHDKLVDYCIEWWEHNVLQYDPKNEILEEWDGQDIIDNYFEFVQDFEWYEEYQDTLKMEYDKV